MLWPGNQQTFIKYQHDTKLYEYNNSNTNNNMIKTELKIEIKSNQIEYRIHIVDNLVLRALAIC